MKLFLVVYFFFFFYPPMLISILYRISDIFILFLLKLRSVGVCLSIVCISDFIVSFSCYYLMFYIPYKTRFFNKLFFPRKKVLGRATALVFCILYFVFPEVAKLPLGITLRLGGVIPVKDAGKSMICGKSSISLSLHSLTVYVRWATSQRFLWSWHCWPGRVAVGLAFVNSSFSV